MTQKIIGQKIKQLRKEHGLTQTKLAEKLGLSYQQIQKYENGESQISVVRLADIAHILQIHITDFFKESNEITVSEKTKIYITEKRNIYRLTHEEGILIKIFRKIESKKIRQNIVKLIKSICEEY